MKVTQIALGVKVVIDPVSLEEHAAASADVIGKELARQVAEYSRSNKLGYFPALDYFRDHEDAVDKELLDAADNLSWLATRLVREEVRKRLRPLFASLRFDAIQNLAFTMPPIRPGQPNAMLRLAEHYAPNTVKLDLTASIVTQYDTAQDMKGHSSHQVYRWLKDHFESVEVTSCRQLD
jgi:hypothetical protein